MIPAYRGPQPGEWAYNPMFDENQRVISVHWDAGIPGVTRSFWRVNLPGYSFDGTIGGRAWPLAPYVEYQQVSFQSWAPRQGPRSPSETASG